ncbi:phosphatidic acid phosphatase type 2/haloperoxidase [Apiospora aurea]|uniref:Phosphatidic acid phosphatase type 2/haloperoxidase n=1 Tax=Apiospora aurea TaxID=335848 RepID=A0ABR1PTP5_9PEZI
MIYSAIWDFHFIHIPLNCGITYFHTGGIELAHAMFTRMAGWGSSRSVGSEKQLGGNGTAATSDANINDTHASGMLRKPVDGHGPARHGDDMV